MKPVFPQKSRQTVFNVNKLAKWQLMNSPNPFPYNTTSIATTERQLCGTLVVAMLEKNNAEIAIQNNNV